MAIEILRILKRSNKEVTLTQLAGTLDVSERTVKRYLDELSCCGVPVVVYRGRYGGVRVEGEVSLF